MPTDYLTVLFSQATRFMNLQGTRYYHDHRPTDYAILWSISLDLLYYINPSANSFLLISPNGELIQEVISADEIKIIATCLKQVCDQIDRDGPQIVTHFNFDEIAIYTRNALKVYALKAIFFRNSLRQVKINIIEDRLFFGHDGNYLVYFPAASEGQPRWFTTTKLSVMYLTPIETQNNPGRDEHYLQEIKSWLESCRIIKSEQ